jgi:hypothetical protein
MDNPDGAIAGTSVATLKDGGEDRRHAELGKQAIDYFLDIMEESMSRVYRIDIYESMHQRKYTHSGGPTETNRRYIDIVLKMSVPYTSVTTADELTIEYDCYLNIITASYKTNKDKEGYLTNYSLYEFDWWFTPNETISVSDDPYMVIVKESNERLVGLLMTLEDMFEIAILDKFTYDPFD